MELGLFNNRSGAWEPFFNERRFDHTLFIGRPNTGIPETLLRLALDDIYKGHAVVWLGPDTLLAYIPEERQADVIYFNPGDRDFPFQFNILSRIEKDKRTLLAATNLMALKGVWKYDDMPTPVMDQYVREGIRTLMDVPGTSLLSLQLLLSDSAFRRKIISKVKDPLLRRFWENFEQLEPREQRSSTASTENKLYAFLLEPLVRNCVAQYKNYISFKDKVVIITLPEGALGRENAAILGALLLSQLYIEGISGLETHLYVNGAERYGTSILMSLMSACPAVSVQLSLQFLGQIEERNREALLGSVGAIVAFKTSVKDAKILEPEFDLATHEHLFATAPGHAIASLDGRTVRLNMPEHHHHPLTPKVRAKIIKRCRSQYTTPREDVERRIGEVLE